MAPHILNIGTDGDERSASRFGRFAVEEIVRDTHWIGGWVGPRFGLDAMKKYPCPYRESNPGRPALSLVTVFTDH
jgi:hypothetical protein